MKFLKQNKKQLIHIRKYNKLPLGQIGQGQTPFLFGFKYWILPIIILLALTVSLGSLGGAELELGRKVNKRLGCAHLQKPKNKILTTHSYG